MLFCTEDGSSLSDLLISLPLPSNHCKGSLDHKCPLDQKSVSHTYSAPSFSMANALVLFHALTPTILAIHDTPWNRLSPSFPCGSKKAEER